MKKRFQKYLIVWAVLFVLFQVIAFVSPGWGGMEKYTPSFWIGYAVITLSLFGQLGCAWVALKSGDNRKTFYNLSLLSVSYTGLVLSFVAGGLCMVISPLPYWVGMIGCALALGWSVLAVVKTTVAIEEVTRIDVETETRTAFIRSMTAEAEVLVTRATREEIKAECKKVQEALRYSDPMSVPALAATEKEIAIRFAALTEAVQSEEAGQVMTLAGEIRQLVDERNKKCRLLK